MCGICGFIDSTKSSSEAELNGLALQMAQAISHRGPDDEGSWAQPDCGLAFGHRRLSIIDLSPAGHQPMISHAGDLVTVYNGEIYNFPQLRAELEKERPELAGSWRGSSDTEIMLEAMELWGVEEAVRRLNGMFAIALWKQSERALYLSRDRLGEKPLYYGWLGKTFFFGSELKALMAHPDFHPEIDRGALMLYLRHNYIPGPHSIYRGVFKLPPATVLKIRPDRPGELPRPVPYWSALEAAQNGLADPLKCDARESAQRLEELMREAVEMRMVSDVPLGAFLSGGIDSSAVVSLMQAGSSRPVKTFSIGFEEEAYNEAQYAKQVANHLGTDHTELYVSPHETLDVVPRLADLYDEPFSDSSQIPTFLVAQMARKHVTVSLSGDAGDELFGGYERYFWALSLWNKIGRLPFALRRVAAGAMGLMPPSALGSLIQGLSPSVPAEAQGRNPARLVSTVRELLRVPSAEAMYLRLVSHWRPEDGIMAGVRESQTHLNHPGQWSDIPHLMPRMMGLDTVSYLPDDILVKVDRAAMGVSLESRVPLLDHRLVELAWRIPMQHKVNNGTGKRVLREVLFRHVPQKLLERPKKGFGVPIDQWLKGPLKAWAEDLLDPQMLKRQGFFEPEVVQKRWSEHQSGVRPWHYHLWDILVFQMWLQRYHG